MTTKQLTYAAELARTQNFNRAAENLFISQPTLTYQIRLLEDEIGFEIFARSGKGAALTPAGEQFIVTIRSVLTANTLSSTVSYRKTLRKWTLKASLMAIKNKYLPAKGRYFIRLNIFLGEN